MSRPTRDLVWIPTFAILVAFAVPWPLWGVDLVVGGLPVWIWWHVAWLVGCSVLFYVFVETGAWERGMGLTGGQADGGTSGRIDGPGSDGESLGGDGP